MARFVPNPTFDTQLALGIGRGIEDMTADIAATAKRNTKSSGYRRGIKARPVRRDLRGPYGEVTTGGGIGNVLEGGTRNRRTKSGANRGSTDAERAIERAVESEVPKGLDLSRYL